MRGEPLGPLHGVPFSAKTSIEVQGQCYDTGSRLRAGFIGEVDAPIVLRLKAAGAIFLGMTNVPELLMAWETDNLLHGRTNSPWSLEHTPGGSSGGEAAAIAAGMSPVGIGSDGGGSIRVPAHFSGICGLKPTPGRIPISGHFPPSGGPFALLGVVGPMARTVADLQILFDVMSGYDFRDPAAAPVLVRHLQPTQLNGVRVSVCEESEVPVAAEVREAVRLAADALRDAGMEPQPASLPWLVDARRLWWTFFGQAGAKVLGPMLEGHESELSPILAQFRSYAAAAGELTDGDVLAAWLQRDELRLRVLAEMQDCPVLLCPPCSIAAFRHRERNWTISGRPVTYVNDHPGMPDVMSYSEAFNLLGFPAAVVPVQQTEDGLPVGVQVVGRPFEEETVLAVAAILDAAFGFRPPPVS